MQKFPIYLEGIRVFSNSTKAINIFDKSLIGERKDGKIIYNSYEAFYLFEKNLAEIIRSKKKLKESELIKTFSKNMDFLTKYLVYKDLKNKGYIIKTGLKFGEEFRVYNKLDYINKHAKYICYPIKQQEKLSLKDLISKIRVSHSTGKKLLLAIVDTEEDILYYEIDWVKI
jgi:tRNA-intron endonuclease, archaea type